MRDSEAHQTKFGVMQLDLLGVQGRFNYLASSTPMMMPAIVNKIRAIRKTMILTSVIEVWCFSNMNPSFLC